MTLLEIRDLTLELPSGQRLLDEVNIAVAAGETVGLVGESGSGKSLTARSVLGLLPAGATAQGSVRCDAQEILGATTSEILEVRRRSAGMVFQDPRAGINPMRTIGDHMTESLRRCLDIPKAAALEQAIELLRAVRLPRPEEHLRQYPHEFSGGMLQRVMIAGALSSAPKLLICDEPTTALDVTTQAEIIRVLQEQRAARGMAMLFITHDLNLAASMCDRLYVMREGTVLENGATRQVFTQPADGYTQQLIDATPNIRVHDRPSAPATTPTPAPVPISESQGDPGRTAPVPDPSGAGESPGVFVSHLSKTYHPRGRGPVTAVRDASLTIPRGGALGIVGESGSGKSTLARMIIGLEAPDSGEIRVAGELRSTAPRGARERRARARTAQMVFQDPYQSLDPRIAVGRVIEDTLRHHTELSRPDAARRAVQLLGEVGLGAEYGQALPRTLSGGQRQRVAIARALAVEPAVLVLDEATSALDVSVQAQVLDLLDRIRAEQDLTILFISHDLGVVRRVCEETLVMQHGVVVESGPTEQLLRDPREPYTRALIESVPRPAWVVS